MRSRAVSLLVGVPGTQGIEEGKEERERGREREERSVRGRESASFRQLREERQRRAALEKLTEKCRKKGVHDGRETDRQDYKCSMGGWTKSVVERERERKRVEGSTHTITAE
jgi:hypothetical protein